MARKEIKVASVFASWPTALKFEEIGETYKGKVLNVKEHHVRDYDTNEPEFWPSGQAKIAPAVIMMVEGEERTWFVDKKEMQQALRAALRAAKVENLAEDDEIEVTFSGTHETERKPGMKKATLSDTKEFEVTVTPNFD